MKMLDRLREGFKFFLMSIGISSTARKPKPQAARETQDGPAAQRGDGPA